MFGVIACRWMASTADIIDRWTSGTNGCGHAESVAHFPCHYDSQAEIEPFGIRIVLFHV